MVHFEPLTAISVLIALLASGSMANAQTDGTSQGAFVFVAGKGKYCKETNVMGDLDCFYASLDACQKHNKSINLRCLVNPSSGNVARQ